MEPLTLGEMWDRAPFAFVVMHVGAFTIGWLFAQGVKAINNRKRDSDDL